MTDDYTGVIMMAILAGVVTFLMISLASWLGPKKLTPEKAMPYETGVEPFSLPSMRRIPVHFYVIAMIFIIFDVELAFLLPWAVLFKELGWVGLIEVSIFVFFILLAFAYAWKTKTLDAK